MSVKIKRIYEPYSPTDGYRILIDRLWPRGVKKEGAHIDKWLKAIAPSTALRKWFDHDPEKWEEFRKRYHDELKRSTAISELAAYVHEHKTLTLLFAAKNEKYNDAIALQQFIDHHSQP